MALPTLDKTWQFNVNQIIPAQGAVLTTNRRVMRTIKNTLIGFGSNPWTVQGSSNSVSAGMDSVDRWVSDSNLVSAAAGVAHSWIVLRQTGIATNYELCIDLASSAGNGAQAGKYVSPSAGFTGGSTTARPTATDEITLPSSGTGWGVASIDDSYILHGMQSTDGQATHVFLMSRHVNTAVLCFARPKNPVSGWTNPSVGMWESENAFNSGTQFEAADESLFHTTTPMLRGRGSAAMSIYLMSEGMSLGFGAGLLVNAFSLPNSVSGEYEISPIGVASDTASHRGRHGQLFDLWTGGVPTVRSGNTYPADGSHQFCQFGIFVTPWNGAIPLTV